MKKINIKTLKGEQAFKLNVSENGSRYINTNIICFSFVGNLIKYSIDTNTPGIIKLECFDEFYFNGVKKY